MSRFPALIAALICCETALVCADRDGAGTVHLGQDITEAAGLLASCADGGLEIAAGTGDELKTWAVGQGVVIAIYSAKTHAIRALTYYLCDERAKAYRKEFRLELRSYDPKSGEALMVLPAVSGK